MDLFIHREKEDFAYKEKEIALLYMYKVYLITTNRRWDWRAENSNARMIHRAKIIILDRNDIEEKFEIQELFRSSQNEELNLQGLKLNTSHFSFSLTNFKKNRIKRIL